MILIKDDLEFEVKSSVSDSKGRYIFNSVEEHKHGPSYWKFNASLLEDSVFLSL